MTAGFLCMCVIFVERGGGKFKFCVHVSFLRCRQHIKQEWVYTFRYGHGACHNCPLHYPFGTEMRNLVAEGVVKIAGISWSRPQAGVGDEGRHAKSPTALTSPLYSATSTFTSKHIFCINTSTSWRCRIANGDLSG